MDKIIITGPCKLQGKVHISGSKNAALPLMAASLLSAEPLHLTHLPDVMDIHTMVELLKHHGCEVSFTQTPDTPVGLSVTLHANRITDLVAPYDIVRKMRASVLVLGPLLARYGEAEVSLPGGCAIGTRPIDLHLDALTAMGATITLKDGYVQATVSGKLRGTTIEFAKVSVGATENIAMAATLAEGTTILKNAAIEPEVTDLLHCLSAMGASIEGIGTSTLTIKGKPSLHEASYRVIPDRIEAGTYAIAAAITQGELELLGVNLHAMEPTLRHLKQAGIHIGETSEHSLRVYAKDRVQAVDMTTDIYPGFPTDMQAQFMALMCTANGTSHITETIFENRLMHVPELARMGADLQLDGNVVKIKGVPQLKAAPVMATDLRASVCLVLAALAAEGKTTISRVYHIDRGYEKVVDKLLKCGARITRTHASSEHQSSTNSANIETKPSRHP